MAEQNNAFKLGSLFSLSPGPLAGLLATIPMTLFLLLMHRFLPKWQQYALPPEEITKEMAARTDTEKEMSGPRLLTATLTAHFSYGASMGSLYATLTKKIPLPPVVKGTLFGFLVWVNSYMGWLPLARFSAAATEEPAQRNVLMISAHLIWGAVTGVLTDLIKKNLS